jgi:hypothetical protein
MEFQKDPRIGLVNHPAYIGIYTNFEPVKRIIERRLNYCNAYLLWELKKDNGDLHLHVSYMPKTNYHIRHVRIFIKNGSKKFNIYPDYIFFDGRIPDDFVIRRHSWRLEVGFTTIYSLIHFLGQFEEFIDRQRYHHLSRNSFGVFILNTSKYSFAWYEPSIGLLGYNRNRYNPTLMRLSIAYPEKKHFQNESPPRLEILCWFFLKYYFHGSDYVKERLPCGYFKQLEMTTFSF